MSDSPRVFQLITRLLRGGAERHLIETVTGLDSYDFTVGYGSEYNQEQVALLEQEGIETVRFPLLRHYNPITSGAAVYSIARYLRREDFDIVHTNSTEAGIVGRFAARAGHVDNVVHTVHGVPFTEDRNRVLNQFVLSCERLAARHTDRIITNADVIAKQYLDRKIGIQNQYRTIYSGIDLESFRNITPATDLPGDRPRVVMVSRLTEGKGLNVLLDAVESLADREASVCIVGEGPLYSDLKDLIASRGLSERVFMTGYRNDIPNVLAASDILVLPSYREGTPRVITEAMASELPVVATNIAGIPEQVVDGETGYLIPTGDSEALAKRIKELLSEQQRREQMGRAGRDRAQQFSVKKMLNSLDDVYTSLLA
jgi:glycosyltransferase involved in cell wall biosynthesis